MLNIIVEIIAVATPSPLFICMEMGGNIQGISGYFHSFGGYYSHI